MTLGEFSNGFDVLVSSYRRFKDFDNRELLDSVEFDEYEKSMFLTKSQEGFVLSLYSGRNPMDSSFDRTEEFKRYLSPLIMESSLLPADHLYTPHIGISDYSTYYLLPSDVWFITYEALEVSYGEGSTCNGNGRGVIEVVPTTQDEYHRVKGNPFRGPNSRRALRLDLSDNMVEIVSKHAAVSYYLRYLKKLSPIVLEDLPDGLSIDGFCIHHPCMLHESLHQPILENAVRLALQSKGYAVDNRETK